MKHKITKAELEWVIHDIINNEGKYESLEYDCESKEKAIVKYIYKHFKSKDEK